MLGDYILDKLYFGWCYCFSGWFDEQEEDEPVVCLVYIGNNVDET